MDYPLTQTHSPTPIHHLLNQVWPPSRLTYHGLLWHLATDLEPQCWCTKLVAIPWQECVVTQWTASLRQSMPDEDALYPWRPPLLAHCKGDRTTRRRRHGMEQGGPQSVIQLAVVAAEASTGLCRWISWDDGELSLRASGKEGTREGMCVL